MPSTHTLSSPSSLMVVLVGSSVPILYQNLACPPRYPLRKGKCCRCRLEPGVLPTLLCTAKSMHTEQSVTGKRSNEVQVSSIEYHISWRVADGNEILNCLTTLDTKTGRKTAAHQCHTSTSFEKCRGDLASHAIFGRGRFNCPSEATSCFTRTRSSE